MELNNLLKSIDNQLQFNQGKNLFLNQEERLFSFMDETVKVISQIDDTNPETEEILIEYTTDKTLQELCRINQYYTFNRSAVDELKAIYSELVLIIRRNGESVDTIAKNHYKNLERWLQRTNPFAEKIYSGSGSHISPVTCSEYSPELQIEILKIDKSSLMEPLLDIGCGKSGKLVNYLCEAGIESFGIDRFSVDGGYLYNHDWLEYDYGTEKWGTIISNLGFSNHFKHHNLRGDGNYTSYAVKYMEILKSLKVGGRFHYAPHLPFIEVYLDSSRYRVEKHEIGNSDFQTTIITRLQY